MLNYHSQIVRVLRPCCVYCGAPNLALRSVPHLYCRSRPDSWHEICWFRFPYMACLVCCRRSTPGYKGRRGSPSGKSVGDADLLAHSVRNGTRSSNTQVCTGEDWYSPVSPTCNGSRVRWTIGQYHLQVRRTHCPATPWLPAWNTQFARSMRTLQAKEHHWKPFEIPRRYHQHSNDHSASCSLVPVTRQHSGPRNDHQDLHANSHLVRNTQSWVQTPI